MRRCVKISSIILITFFLLKNYQDGYGLFFGTRLSFKKGEKMKLVVIIPAYNEEASIGSVIKKIPKNLLEKASPKNNISETEVIVIDDGSTDNTRKISIDNGAVVVSHVGNIRFK